jgi:hypothetical protein
MPNFLVLCTVYCDNCRSCSFAAFGPTSNHVTFPSKTIVGPMTRLKSKESCHPPEQEKDLDEYMLSDSEGIKVSDSYDGTVVVADRGSCMFEEKTIAAENAGAEAVVIVNSEVRPLSHMFCIHICLLIQYISVFSFSFFKIM